ncbi:hypothetical protein [Pseudomonas viridiflava]|uniref:hypothetical protein n=1 Tax=Pseudomonas viridiflava TaxID=33069 RepID=UPI000F024E76|nr:hypothetical protein [Pseudomonas viridiflava]
MSEQELRAIRFTLFKHSRDSFLAVLDDACIPHSSVKQFSVQPQASGFVELVVALSDAMPWNAIAKVIIAWIDARKSRRVMLQVENGTILIETSGHSAKDVERLLKTCAGVTVIDTLPQVKDNVAPESNVV